MTAAMTEWTAPDKSFMKIILTKGVGTFSPLDGALCKVKILGDESCIVSAGLDEDHIKELTIGEADSEADRFLESFVTTMKEGETSEVLFSYIPENVEKSGEEVRVSPVKITVNGEEDCYIERKIEKDEEGKSHSMEIVLTPTDEREPSDSDKDEAPTDNKLQEEREQKESDEGLNDKIRIELLYFTRQPEIWEMSITEKWRRSVCHRERGVDLFVEGRYRWAFRRFASALKYLISLEMDIPSEQLEDDVDVKGSKLICYLNLAACHLKKTNYEYVVRCCTKALELDAYHPKALYRRGTALMYLQDYEKAQVDLNKALEIEPGNTSILKQQQLLKKRMQNLNHYYANAMRKMFH